MNISISIEIDYRIVMKVLQFKGIIQKYLILKYAFVNSTLKCIQMHKYINRTLLNHSYII